MENILGEKQQKKIFNPRISDPGDAAGKAASGDYLSRVADHTKRIAEIRKILAAGATSVTTDGTTVEFDFAQLRKELRRLLAEDDANAGRRPVAASIYLG